jgi:hypothetical protein
MMLCGLRILLKFLFGRVLDLMRSHRGFEYRQLLARLEASEALDCLHHAGCRPTQRHGGVSPSLHVVADAADGPYHVFNAVGAGERATELCWQTEAVDGEDLVETFEDASGYSGRLLLEPASETAQQPFSLVGVVELPRLSQRFAHRGMQRLG